MKTKLRRAARSVVAGLWLLAALARAGAQPAPTAPGTAVHGTAIDGAAAMQTGHAGTISTNIVIRLTDGIVSADFETLSSFNFEVPDMTATNHPTVAQAEKQIPAVIKNLDGKIVRIRGFMMPIKEVQGKSTEFLITRCQPSCCFAGAAAITDFVTVKAAGKGFDTMMDDPITIQGTLHVGAILDSGYIVGLYELDADKVIPPKS